MMARSNLSLCLLVSCCLALVSLAVTGKDLDEFKVKREAVYDFAKRPTVSSEGDRVTIAFTTKGFCDVTVAIEDTAGQIVRHLASGVLGKNAPPPYKRGSRKQAVVWDGKDSNYDRLPGDLQLNADAAYVHFTSNETIQGVQFLDEPHTSDVPLVCDASSDFLCRPLPIDRYGLIYACAQKKAGTAGVTVLIIREDLLDRCQESLPGYLNYRLHVQENSLYNTPPTFAVYLAGLVFRWLRNEVGGVANMLERNLRKSQMLYEVIDDSDDFFQGHAQQDCRSMMNVTFRLPSDELQQAFLNEASRRGLCELKGHRSVGGIRASIYNAMPIEGVELLRDLMLEFCDENSH